MPLDQFIIYMVIVVSPLDRRSGHRTAATSQAAARGARSGLPHPHEHPRFRLSPPEHVSALNLIDIEFHGRGQGFRATELRGRRTPTHFNHAATPVKPGPSSAMTSSSHFSSRWRRSSATTSTLPISGRSTTFHEATARWKTIITPFGRAFSPSCRIALRIAVDVAEQKTLPGPNPGVQWTRSAALRSPLTPDAGQRRQGAVAPFRSRSNLRRLRVVRLLRVGPRPALFAFIPLPRPCLAFLSALPAGSARGALLPPRTPRGSFIPSRHSSRLRAVLSVCRRRRLPARLPLLASPGSSTPPHTHGALVVQASSPQIPFRCATPACSGLASLAADA